MTVGDGAASGLARDGHHPKKGEAAARAPISKPDDQPLVDALEARRNQRSAHLKSHGGPRKL
jgi:hypothetical protein